MITINDINDGRCNCCHSKEELKEILLECEDNGSGHLIVLCSKCRKELVGKLKDGEQE